MSDTAHHAELDALLKQAVDLELHEQTAAHHLAQEIYAQAQNSPPPYLKAMAEARLITSSYYERAGQHKESIQDGNEALSLFETLGLPEKVAAACHLLGWNYLSLGDYPLGMSYALRQLGLLEGGPALKGQADAHNLLGALYTVSQAGFSAKAVEHYEKSLALYRQLGMAEHEATLLSNLCVAYDKGKNYPQALSYGQASLALSEKIADYDSQILNLSNLAGVYHNLEDRPQARAHYARALALLRQYSYTKLESHVLMCLAHIEREEGNLPAALAITQEALTIAEDKEQTRAQYECHEHLSQIYEARGDYALALKHYQRYHALEKKITEDQRKAELEHLHLRYDLEKTKHELELERDRHQQDRRYFERVHKLQDDLLHSTSHDLKNPLSSIFLIIDLMALHYKQEQQGLAQRDSSQIPRLIDRLHRVAGQMQDLVQQLLNKTIIESGRAIHPQAVNLESFMQGLVLDTQDMFHQHGAPLELDLGQYPSEALFDPHQMRQVLVNLLSNAVKYSPPAAPVTLRLAAEAGHLVFWVQDQGMGIPDEALPHLFTPFYRVNRPDHLKVEGNGLGLSIVKSIVEQHVGQVRVHSQLGGGTQFEVRLPLPPP
jgi:signal transduction histidine kinase